MTAEWIYDKLAACPRKVWCLLLFVVALTVALSLLLSIHLTTDSKETSPPSGQQETSQALAEEWRPECPSFPRYDCMPELTRTAHFSNDFPGEAWQAVSRQKTACTRRGCCWEPPKCFYPTNYGYVAEGPGTEAHLSLDVPLRRLPAPSRFPSLNASDSSPPRLILRIEMQTSYRLRVKIFDPRNARYEVPGPPLPKETEEDKAQLYQVTHSSLLGLSVKRKETQTIIFDTTEGKLVFTDQFLELTTRLPSNHIFGEIQNQPSRTWTMFDHESPDPRHPMYLCLETETGHAHGVLLFNSNLMELHYSKTPAMTFRTTGGILDFYIFLGPSPEDVIKQYTEATGRPLMPTFWSLGFQLGYSGYLSQSHLDWVLRSMRNHHIPQESVYLDTAFQEEASLFLLEPGQFPSLPMLIDGLHERDQKLILTIHPQIATTHPAYTSGRHRGVLVNDSHGTQPIIGLINDAPVVFPDFGNPATQTWWTQFLYQLHQSLKFDGLSLERNEPTNHVAGSVQGCEKNSFNFPPYPIKKRGESVIFEQTLCMDSLHMWGACDPEKHYNLYSLYGLAMARQTQNSLSDLFPGQRTHVLSHSTFMGSTVFAGAFHKYNNASWKDLQNSLMTLLHFSQQGFPFAGSTVCGYHGEADEELCLRWFQFGAFNPLFLSVKSSNSRDQDPSRFSKKFMRVVRQAILKRYQLLPYLYTLFHLAHAEGSTVARPLFHEFPKDRVTHGLKRQFMWGPALLISPVLDKGSESVYAYFPSGLWYDLYTGEPLHSEGQWETLPAQLYLTGRPVHLHIRGGHIIPAIQKPGNTTTASRRSPLKLLVALNSSSEAEGTLYWDDGVTKDAFENGEYILVTMNAAKNRLVTTGHSGPRAFAVDFNQVYVQSVRLMGIPRRPREVTIDSAYHLTPKQQRWNQTFRVLDILNVLIPLTRTTIIEWFYD